MAEVIRENESYKSGLVFDVLNALYRRFSDHDIDETQKTPSEIVRDIFNDNNIWDKVYDAIEEGDNSVNKR